MPGLNPKKFNREFVVRFLAEHPDAKDVDFSRHTGIPLEKVRKILRQLGFSELITTPKSSGGRPPEVVAPTASDRARVVMNENSWGVVLPNGGRVPPEYLEWVGHYFMSHYNELRPENQIGRAHV